MFICIGQFDYEYLIKYEWNELWSRFKIIRYTVVFSKFVKKKV